MSRFAFPSALLFLLFATSACEPAGTEGFLVELSARVVDENNSGAAGVEVNFATTDGALVAELVTDDEGWLRFPVYGTEILGHALWYEASGSGYAPTQGWVDIDLRAPESTLLRADPPNEWALWDRLLPPIRVIDEDVTGGVRLTLYDASTGESMPDGVEVSLRQGWNTPDSESVVSTFVTVENEGLVKIIGVPPGMYTLQIDAGSGYEQTRFPVPVTAAGDGHYFVTMSPALARSELRATLSWSNSPADLDLHLTGPTKEGLSDQAAWERFHVYSEAPRHPALAPEEDTVVELESESNTGYGPESVFVHELVNDGSYHLSVYDTASQYEFDTVDLGNSFAVVQLWIGDVGSEFFEVSPGVGGNTWQATVYEVEDELWYRTQSYFDEIDPSSVLSF